MKRSTDWRAWTGVPRDELIDEIEELELEIERLEKLLDGRLETECRRCHRIFRGLPEEYFCTRDCEMQWTQAPSYEEWYQQMHPNSVYLRNLHWGRI